MKPDRSLSTTFRDPHSTDPRIKSRTRTGTLYLLNSLCDLQIITGIAIIVAGLAQISTITFYHEQFVLTYWFLTLNSFWAARGDYTYRDPSLPPETRLEVARTTLRIVAILCSTILALVFQIHIVLRETLHWSFLQSGRCYISNDHSGLAQEWVWVAGSFLYVIFLFATLNHKTKQVLDKSFTEFHRFDEYVDRCKRSRADLDSSFASLFFKRPSPRETFKHIIEFVVALAIFLSLSAIAIIWWCTTQFLCLWSYGAGFYPVEVLFYAGFAGWNTFDIIDLKLSNRDLVVGSETSWGFGQVLPLVLLAMILFNTLDAYQDAKP